MSETGIIIVSHAKHLAQGLVDLIHMLDDDQEGVVAYLRDETEPFYVRAQGKKKGFFARLFS